MSKDGDASSSRRMTTFVLLNQLIGGNVGGLDLLIVFVLWAILLALPNQRVYCVK
ncbi:hypothetical protein BP00DRAFT_431426 [Aspergillus indologenus CBS 114.80]|uniref:Uncharacterized protein n=1 Tax=Aspergillus indologenus CBS 114.80 TaxID=1450541 RepID=A0A2V5HRK1_9EURO|nr:hypothetical protein BP00DRAFT_431426 [Aspergillus indologenus CBS 114.80]